MSSRTLLRRKKAVSDTVPLKPAEGYGSYRTNTAFMDKVADTYGPVQGSINRRLKKTLDPERLPDIGKIRYPLTMSASSP